MEAQPPADYEAARRAAVSGYESQVGPVSDACYEDSKCHPVTEVDPVPCAQDPGMVTIGCVIGNPPVIYILSTRDWCQKEDIAVHEYIHALAGCETGDGDGEHLDPTLWETDGSAEMYGLAIL